MKTHSVDGLLSDPERCLQEFIAAHQLSPVPLQIKKSTQIIEFELHHVPGMIYSNFVALERGREHL